jgi:hypothetical protein
LVKILDTGTNLRLAGWRGVAFGNTRANITSLSLILCAVLFGIPCSIGITSTAWKISQMVAPQQLLGA